MIKKIKQIKNIGIFKDFSWNSSISEFKNYNAFYGWNGTGKTTITRILSVFEKGEIGSLKLEDDSKCIIETDSGVLELSKFSIPDALKNNIRVFNEDFINDNLNWKEGKASPILIIGKLQKERKNKLDEIKDSLEKKKNELRQKENEREKKEKEKRKILERARNKIKESLRGVVGVKPKSARANDYINYTVVDVENVLKGEEELKLNDDEIFQLKNSLKEREVKDIIFEMEADFTWIDDVISNSQKIFDTIIPEAGLKLLNEKDEKLKEWLRIGHEIHRDKEKPVVCEFCKNEISEERLKELADYFNDILINLINNINETIIKIEQNDIPAINLQKEQFYSEFQSNFLELSNNFTQQKSRIKSELNKIKEALKEKRKKPSQKFVFDFSVLKEEVENIKNTIKQLNDLISKNNKNTELFEDKLKELAHKLEVGIISKYKSDYNEKVKELKTLQSDIDSLTKEKKELENRKNELEQKLKEHHIAAGRFNGLLTSFMGRDEIILETKDEGYIIKRKNSDEPAKNLSESERNAIALIYFLIKLEEENFDANNGIVVIDDPVSSFDSQNLYRAFGFIKEKIKDSNPKQVFIFTHNFPFFRLIRNWVSYENHSFYMIKSKIRGNERHSVIKRIDKLLEKYNSEYTFLFKFIYQRAKSQDGSLEQDYIFPNVIRKFLENYISFKVPIGGVNIHEKFKKLCEDYLEIEQGTKTYIESYCQDQSHPLYQDSPTDFDTRLLGEIQEVCRAVIKLLEITDPKHYQHLKEKVGNKNV